MQAEQAKNFLSSRSLEHRKTLFWEEGQSLSSTVISRQRISACPN